MSFKEVVPCTGLKLLSSKIVVEAWIDFLAAFSKLTKC